MMQPILSVLIPTRNRAGYVRHAIQSALNIPSERVEVLVSENHGSDNGYEVCQSIQDSRLRVYRPDRPLPMHENWEFLLNHASGEWVTFIGDDDAIMPHAADHLQYISDAYPQAEALVSPRALYFWEGCQEEYGNACMSVRFTDIERWHDSKADLQSALDQKINYIDLPQLYSGGFQRRSLIQRVMRSQNGVYFKSVTPDAYSALMACLHTYRFLEIGVPLSWVGTSPHNALKTEKASAKDRFQDFFGFHSDDVLTTHHALGDMRDATFGMFFYESYLSAFPLTSYKELSMQRMRSVFESAAVELRKRGKDEVVRAMSKRFGFAIPAEGKRSDSKTLWAKTKREIARASGKLVRLGRNTPRPKTPQTLLERSGQSHVEFPTICAADELLSEGYSLWRELGLGRDRERVDGGAADLQRMAA
ncbi:MAG: glycosyltransferase family A protein [Planctomycetota bacterium]